MSSFEQCLNYIYIKVHLACRFILYSSVSIFQHPAWTPFPKTKFIRQNFTKRWPWNLWKTQGKWRNGESSVLLNLLIHCTYEIFINHRQSAASQIMHIFASFFKLSHLAPYHWITHGMFSIHLTKLTNNVSRFHVSCIQKRITDRISHVTGFLIFLNIVNTQDSA
jgi:hypothetical protein